MILDIKFDFVPLIGWREHTQEGATLDGIEVAREYVRLWLVAYKASSLRGVLQTGMREKSIRNTDLYDASHMDSVYLSFKHSQQTRYFAVDCKWIIHER